VEIECGSVMMIRQFLRASDALSLLSPDQVQVEIAAGILTSRPPLVSVSRTIGISTRDSWRPTAAQAAFVQILRSTGSEVSA
jgi:DNA-binding transcriptional LysR family regulator